jgi:hypothetical protein
MDDYNHPENEIDAVYDQYDLWIKIFACSSRSRNQRYSLVLRSRDRYCTAQAQGSFHAAASISAKMPCSDLSGKWPVSVHHASADDEINHVSAQVDGVVGKLIV